MEQVKAFVYDEVGEIRKVVLAGIDGGSPVWVDVTSGRYFIYNKAFSSCLSMRFMCEEGEKVRPIVMMNWLGCVMRSFMDKEARVLTDHLKMARELGIEWTHDPISLFFGITNYRICGKNEFSITIEKNAYTPSYCVEVEGFKSYSDAQFVIRKFVEVLETEADIPVTTKILSIPKDISSMLTNDDKAFYNNIKIEIQ